ncbi:MAG: hypothetical protein JW816_03890 [Candidatus Buchananbacteria bacterium]|nr:hypothetical protein [Candidatus Buchananbacteria bacterium]
MQTFNAIRAILTAICCGIVGGVTGNYFGHTIGLTTIIGATTGFILGFVFYDPSILLKLIPRGQKLSRRLAIFTGAMVVSAIFLILPITTVLNTIYDRLYPIRTFFTSTTAAASAIYCLASIIINIMMLYEVRLPNEDKDSDAKTANHYLNKVSEINNMQISLPTCALCGFLLMMFITAKIATNLLKGVGIFFFFVFCALVWALFKSTLKLQDLEWRLPTAFSAAIGAIVFVLANPMFSVAASSFAMIFYLASKRISRDWLEKGAFNWDIS